MQQISVLQPSGDVIVLDITPESTGRELKELIKDSQPWDELTRRTTSVELIGRGNHLLGNDDNVLDAGIAGDIVPSAVFRQNMVICSHQDAFAGLGCAVDSQSLLTPCSGQVDHPAISDSHWESRLCELQQLDGLDHPKLSRPHWQFCLPRL